MNSFLFHFVLMLLLSTSLAANSTVGIKASSDVTVSGVSSGGTMASQMLVAYSSQINGAGIFAAPPYYCTRGVVAELADCMTTGLAVFVDQIILAAEGFEKLGLIDKLSNLLNTKVYMFSGKKDLIVWPNIVKKHEKFFRKLGADITSEYGLNAQHSMPTDFFGNRCTKLGSPFINNCDYKGSRHALEYIMDQSLNPKVDYIEANLHSFDQGKYNPGITSSFADSGMVYIPEGCKSKECPLHVVFHGCEQTVKDIGLDYVYGTGYLGLAEANDIIILFPQVKASSTIPFNPKGCWDWWGYSEVIPTPLQWSFPTKDGTQTKAVFAMIKDLQAGTFGVHSEFAFKDIPVSSY